MKLRTSVAFVLGVVIGVASLGATTWLRAADDSIITACTNKKTGVMRYLIKGSCNKKTETKVTWNQMGATGAQGIKGDPGTKGDAGAAGPPGTTGKSARVIDAAGRDHGFALGVYDHGVSVAILFDGGIWTLKNTDGRDKVSGYLSSGGTYSDSGCTTALWFGNSPMSDQLRGANALANGTTLYVKAVGSVFRGSTVDVYYSAPGSQSCNRSTFFDNEIFTAVEVTTGPTFSPPFRLVVE